MPATLMIEFGRQCPLLGYHHSELPNGEGDTYSFNIGMVGLMWFKSSLPELLERWSRVNRQEAWQAVTGGASGPSL